MGGRLLPSGLQGPRLNWPTFSGFDVPATGQGPLPFPPPRSEMPAFCKILPVLKQFSGIRGLHHQSARCARSGQISRLPAGARDGRAPFAAMIVADVAGINRRGGTMLAVGSDLIS